MLNSNDSNNSIISNNEWFCNCDVTQCVIQGASWTFCLDARPGCLMWLWNYVQAQSKQPPPGSMQSDNTKRGPATQSHAVHSVFDSLADMDQDQEESVVKSWSSGLDGLQESQPVKHEDEGLDVGQYNSIRSGIYICPDTCVTAFSLVRLHRLLLLPAFVALLQV